jgi:vacuolar-type H+-ATPase subunit F/Vma7
VNVKLAVIADEVTAMGWRLIGARVLLPGVDTARDCLREALGSADMVLITAQYARAIPSAELNAALLASSPLALVIADLRHNHEPPEIEHEVRRALGVPV